MANALNSSRLRLALLLACAPAAIGTSAQDSALKPVTVTVRLELEGAAALEPSAVKFATFPCGKRCAFTYTGPSQPKTIEFMSKLGFRTTLYVGPTASPDRLKALEEAGAEIGVTGYWGAKGGYASLIEQNSVQEAYDAVTTTRMVLRKSVKGPLACGAIEGHISMAHFPLNRNMDNPDGYGAVFQDTNFLLLLDNKPYAVFLGREGPKPITLRDKNDNVMETRNVPNELIYYQILAGQFQGTLKRATKGQIVRYSIRDFKAPDLDELSEVIGEYGKNPLIWHATEGEIGGYEYAKGQTRVTGVKANGGAAVDVTLALARDTHAPFLLSPLCLELPKGTPVKSARAGGQACKVTTGEDGIYVDVPLKAILSDGVEVSLATAAPDLTIPDEMSVTLTVRNLGSQPIENARLECVGCPGIGGGPGLALTADATEAFRLGPNEERKVAATVRTVRGARSGLTPVETILTYTRGGEERTCSAGFEIAVAPRLSVEMDPMSKLPLPPGRAQHFEVHLSNAKSSKPGGPPSVFLSHKAGPCMGVVTFDLPAGMKAVPAEQPFELAADSEKTLLFRIENQEWAEGAAKVRPLVRFDGEKEPVEVLCPGTTIIRDKNVIDYKPLDDKGLLVYASWDEKEKGGSFDKSTGPAGSYYYPGHSPGYSNEGVKGWCMESARSCQIYQTFKNIECAEGTLLFWFRRDPVVRNELQVKGDPANSWKQGVNRGNDGESMIVVGNVQRRGYSEGGMCLRRYPGWEGKEGYLDLVYKCLGPRLYHVSVPYEKARQFEWRHCAMLWSAKDRRLELYLDGELKGKADPGTTEWYPVPWDNAGISSHPLILLTTDHGHWSGTCRDEVYIYNRALTAEEIKANLELAKKK